MTKLELRDCDEINKWLGGRCTPKKYRPKTEFVPNEIIVEFDEESFSSESEVARPTVRSLSLDGGLDIFRFVQQHYDESLYVSQWTFDSGLDNLSTTDDFWRDCKSCEDLPSLQRVSALCDLTKTFSSGNLPKTAVVAPAVAMLRRSVNFRSISYDGRREIIDTPCCDDLRRSKIVRSSSAEMPIEMPSVLKNTLNSLSQDVMHLPAIAMLRRNVKSFRSITYDRRLNTDTDSSVDLKNARRRKGVRSYSTEMLDSNRLRVSNSSSRDEVSRDVEMLRRINGRSISYDDRTTQKISMNEDANVIDSTSKDIECNCALCKKETKTSVLRRTFSEMVSKVVRSRGYDRDMSFYRKPVKVESDMYVCLIRVLEFIFGLWFRHFDHK